jgi:hypothetical protein
MLRKLVIIVNASDGNTGQHFAWQPREQVIRNSPKSTFVEIV